MQKICPKNQLALPYALYTCSIYMYAILYIMHSIFCALTTNSHFATIKKPRKQFLLSLCLPNYQSESQTTNLLTRDCGVMLEEGIHERIVGTIFECTEHHQTIATFRSWRTFLVPGVRCSGVCCDGVRHGDICRDVIHPN